MVSSGEELVRVRLLSGRKVGDQYKFFTFEEQKFNLQEIFSIKTGYNLGERSDRVPIFASKF